MSFGLADIARVDFNKSGGLVPAIIQHVDSGAVLMLGYMNSEALRETLLRGHVVFYSRSKQRLWEKGETSGHKLALKGIQLDCDADTLLVSALPTGPVCHQGTKSCFGDELQSAAERLAFLVELQHVIVARLAAGSEGSYTASLAARGVRHIAQKVGEEGLEVALAGAGESDERLRAESADLLFHLMVLLQVRGIELTDVIAELNVRHQSRGTTTL